MNTRRALGHSLGRGSALLVSLALAACSGADPGSCPASEPGCTTLPVGNHDGGSASSDDGGGSVDTDSSGGATPLDGGHTSQGDGGHGPGTGDGGGPHDSGLGTEGGAGGFGEACTANADCPATYPVCFTFNAKGQHCTKACASAADCLNPPNLGCSGMGVCKIP